MPSFGNTEEDSIMPCVFFINYISIIRRGSFKRSYCLCFLIIISISATYSQENYIRDSGFDSLDYKKGWFFASDDFNQTFRFWNTPSVTSPDAYGPGIDIPEKWHEIGFGEIADTAKHKYVVGFTLYGCNVGKRHCREFLMTRLNHRMTPNESYLFSLDILPMAGTIRIDRIGLLFTKTHYTRLPESGMLGLSPQFLVPLETQSSNAWVTITDTIRNIPQDHNYLIIGNFNDDATTSTSDASEELPFSYYYVDNIRLTPILSDGDRSQKGYQKWLPLTHGKTIILDKIYFSFDKFELSPHALDQLNNLYLLMLDHPRLNIRLRGHTDQQGSKAYNQSLSESRSKSVYEWLVSRGIDAQRIEYIGYGEELPITIEDTEDAHKKNRRVEFEILSF